MTQILRFSPFRHGGIRRRLLLWNLALFGTVLSGVMLASYLYAVTQMKERSAELQSEIASVTAERIASFVEHEIQRLTDTAAAMSLYAMGSQEQSILAALAVKHDPAFTDATVLSGKGRELVKLSDKRIYLTSEYADQSHSAKFRSAINGNNYVSAVYTSANAQPYITLAVPLRIKPGEVIGVFSVEANLGFLWQLIGDVHFGAAGYAYLVDGQGNLIAHKDPPLVLKKLNLSHTPAVQEFLRTPKLRDATPAYEQRGMMGLPVMSTYAPIRRLGWGVILEEPLDAAMINVHKMARFAVLFLSLGLLAATVMMVLISNRITRPIQKLQLGAACIRNGDLEHEIEIKTGDEIQSLAEELNRMARELKTSYSTLEQKVVERTQELAALYDVTTIVNQSLELDPVLQQVIKRLTEIFHFDAIRILLFDKHREELHVRASSECAPELLQRVGVLKRGQGIAGRVGDTGEPMIFEDIHDDPRYLQLSHSKANQQLSLRCLAVFPIKAKTWCAGTLLCAGRMPRRLAASEIQLIMSMAAQIGVAVENTGLYGDLKNKTALLETTNLELEEASHTKSKFMAAMSHELRTPLNVINGIVQLMVDRFFGDLTEEQERYLRKVMHHGKILLKLINDVLTVTALEARKMTLDTVTVDLHEIVAHVKGYTEQLSRNGHLEILWKDEPRLPAIVTDPVKLEEILQNLIGNAYKFTPQGSIEIAVRDLEAKARVEFTVKDTGIGIDNASLEQIFEEFHQLKEAHTGSFNGFGLGLNIVKNYLELMRGDIRVESQIGIGTTFTFTLPYSLEQSSALLS